MDRWREDGFAILRGYLSAAAIRPALAELPSVFPTADAFHDDVDAERNAPYRAEFGGVTDFPFVSTELSLLAVHDSLIDLAERLLGTKDLRVIGIEAWAKFSGAAAYDQDHHRDYLSHGIVAPSTDPRFEVLELFLYLVDTPVALGPTAVVSRRLTADLPALPNWFAREAPDAEDPWRAANAHPDLYEHEVRAEGPAGTVVAYTNSTFHRATELTAPRGARYTLMANFRAAGNDWNTRHNWQQHANTDCWHAFVERASPRQLALFGWPPPGHPYWTDDTIEGTQQRYPNLDLAPWRTAVTP